MEKLPKQKIIAEVSLKDSLSDWKEVVYQRANKEYLFWEDSWNDSEAK